MNLIQLHGYFPKPHLIAINPDYITAIEDNAINENSRGSIVHTGETEFMVTEDPQEVVRLIKESQ